MVKLSRAPQVQFRSLQFRAGIVWLLFFFLACGAHLAAQEKTFLWKAQGANNTVYLLGSIHLLKKDSAVNLPAIEAAFNQAKRLAFEIDLANENLEATQRLILQKGINLDGKTLRDKISKETFELATAWASGAGVDIQLLLPFKPWLAGVTMILIELQKLGYDPSFGVDRQLAARAKQAGKPVSGLESAASQFDLFDGLSAELQEMLIRQSVEETQLLGKMIDEMIAAWRSGNVNAAERLFLQSMNEYPELRERLLDQRNRNWLPQIEKFLQGSDDALVVVGAAHLVGKNGVIELLKSRGYKVEQM